MKTGLKRLVDSLIDGIVIICILIAGAGLARSFNEAETSPVITTGFVSQTGYDARKPTPTDNKPVIQLQPDDIEIQL